MSVMPYLVLSQVSRLEAQLEDTRLTLQNRLGE